MTNPATLLQQLLLPILLGLQVLEALTGGCSAAFMAAPPISFSKTQSVPCTEAPPVRAVGPQKLIEELDRIPEVRTAES